MDEVFKTPVGLTAQDFILGNGQLDPNVQYLVAALPCLLLDHISGLFNGTEEEFRVYLNELWFGTYDRGAPDSSSGFERVFMGEIDSENEVGGYHNWIKYGQADRQNIV